MVKKTLELSSNPLANRMSPMDLENIKSYLHVFQLFPSIFLHHSPFIIISYPSPSTVHLLPSTNQHPAWIHAPQ